MSSFIFVFLQYGHTGKENAILRCADVFSEILRIQIREVVIVSCLYNTNAVTGKMERMHLVILYSIRRLDIIQLAAFGFPEAGLGNCVFINTRV